MSDPAQVVAQITGTADQIAGTGTNWQFGRVNALKAVCFPAPLGLRLTGLPSPSTLQFSWTDTTPGESRFEVVYNPTTVKQVATLTVPANTTSVTLVGLTPGVTYDTRVRACDAFGCSGFSNTVTATAGFKSLNVSVLGAGKVTGVGITCGQTSTDCSELYAAGSVVHLRATPLINELKNIEWDFDHWEGACAGQTLNCTLTMSSSLTTKAVFVQVSP
jgi:hypothetical protein